MLVVWIWVMIYLSFKVPDCKNMKLDPIFIISLSKLNAFSKISLIKSRLVGRSRKAIILGLIFCPISS